MDQTHSGVVKHASWRHHCSDNTSTAAMEALGLKRKPPTMMERVQDMFWEVVEELFIYF